MSEPCVSLALTVRVFAQDGKRRPRIDYIVNPRYRVCHNLHRSFSVTPCFSSKSAIRKAFPTRGAKLLPPLIFSALTTGWA